NSYYEVEGSVVVGAADFTRVAGGAQPNAPFAVEYPMHNRFTTTIRLPDGGRGFFLPGPDISKTIAGVQFQRVSKINGPLVTMQTPARALAPEFPAAEAPAASESLRALARDALYINAPASMKSGALANPVTSDDYLARAGIKMQQRDYVEAISDFDKAI